VPNVQIGLLNSIKKRKVIEVLRLEQNRRTAARVLGIARNTIWEMIDRWDIGDHEWKESLKSEWRPLDHYLPDSIWYRLQLGGHGPPIPVERLEQPFKRPAQPQRPPIVFPTYTQSRKRVRLAAAALGLPPIIDVNRMNPFQVRDLLTCAHLCFRKYAVTHHPDKGGDQESFKALNLSFQTIKDYAEHRGVSLDLPNGSVATQ